MKRHFLKLFVLIATLALTSSIQIKAQRTRQTPLSKSMVVSTEWLAKNLNDDSLVLLQVGDKDEYTAGHIPGAQFIWPTGEPPIS